jgi:GNAT superfamily N-acetyltransferase
MLDASFWESSPWRNNVLQILRQHQGLHAVYLLKADELDGVLGEAVVSESENEVRLHEIFVKAEHRGRGYGEALMKAVLSYGEARLVTLCTGLGNVPFFERYGFEVTHVGDSLISMERRP